MLEQIKSFLTSEAFLGIEWWIIIAAAVGVALIIIITSIAVACSKKKKAKKAAIQKADAVLKAKSEAEKKYVNNDTDTQKQDDDKKEIDNNAVEVADNTTNNQEIVETETTPLEKDEIAEDPTNETQNVVEEPVEESPIEKEEEINVVVDTEEPMVEEPVTEEPTAVEENVAKEPVVEETIEEKADDNKIVEENQPIQEEIAVTSADNKDDIVPRGLPDKKDKIAIASTAKAQPKAKAVSDKPVVVGTDKLPNKPAKKNLTKEEIKATKDAERDALISTDPTVETFGKFVIIKNSNEARPYNFRLLANNGQILFESEPYKVKPRANNIVAFKKNAVEKNFETDEDKAGNWRYKLYSNNHTLIGVGESYTTKQACINSIQSVVKFAESAHYLEDLTIEKEEE